MQNGGVANVPTGRGATEGANAKTRGRETGGICGAQTRRPHCRALHSACGVSGPPVPHTLTLFSAPSPICAPNSCGLVSARAPHPSLPVCAERAFQRLYPWHVRLRRSLRCRYQDQLLGKFSFPPHADIILRSSDLHDLRVQKSYVVDTSPVLGEQIMAKTCYGTGPGAITMGSLPVVRLPESHTILSSLLTFVFPVTSVLPPTIEQIMELLSVAQKYEMTTTLARIRDCASRRDPPLICANTALQVYSLAWEYGLPEETLLAAKETLRSPMTINTYEDKLDFISTPALCGL
ncbi:hypothetical protein EI94DRAFT_552924 [Lactarius quietus]|nr:hypothetical protein EI94DRAFT_552924 [Lactarius quietus]